ncbi:helix-turn-helix domain-containing protein [Actinophytocola sediminis]
MLNDDTDHAPADPTDQAIVRAIGEELRRARGSAGWSRPELIKRMKTPVPVNTLAGYEQGIRACPTARLVEICLALDINVTELLGLALQRLEINLERSGVQIDLHKILSDEREELRPLRRWAKNRIKADVTTTDPGEPAVVRLPWAVVTEMAIFCGISRRKLLNYIRDFTPGSAVRP